MFVIMNKKSKYKDDKPDLYDVLKDNPRWAEEEKKSNNSAVKKDIPPIIKED